MTRNGITCVEWRGPVSFRQLMTSSIRFCDLYAPSEATAEPSVYLFEDETGPLYVGATNRGVAHRAYRHLSNADAPALRDLLKRAAAGTAEVNCRWIAVDGSPFALERQIIRAMQPHFNRLDWEKRNVPRLPDRKAA